LVVLGFELRGPHLLATFPALNRILKVLLPNPSY
jgi:hypothetical protein